MLSVAIKLVVALNMLAILYAALLFVAAAGSLVLTLFGLPGNWLLLAFAAAYAYLLPGDSAAAIGWQTVAVLAAMAAVGELLELVAGAAGAAKAGGSRRGAVLALVGSGVGALAGAVVGLPVPLVGSIIAALLFAGVGAMAGAIAGELWAGRAMEPSWNVGRAAFRGRIVGTLAKIAVGGLMLLTLAAALVV